MTTVSLVPGLSPGFVVVAGVAGLLLVCAFALALAAIRFPERNSRDAVIALLGAAGVALHVVLAVRNPASLVGFLFGTGGASAAVVAAFRRVDASPNDLTAQGLGVTGLVWIAGSVTVVGGTVATAWPFALAGVAGAVTLTGAVIASRVDPGHPTLLAYRRPSLVLGTASLVPALVGFAFGPEVLFICYLVAVGVLVVCWWLVRAGHATGRGR